MKSRLQTALHIFVLTLLCAFTVNAQSGADLKADLTPSLPQLPPPPVPLDENGNPIPIQQPTAEQLEALRIEQEHRAEQIRVEEEQRAAEAARIADEERRAAELLAEQKQFHDRFMWAVYIGLGLLAIFVGSRIFKKDE
ncbi:MAG: hypothetical protein ACREO1_02495 [Arenimonas sp.]